MRVNIYAEEMSDRVELVTKRGEGREFVGVRFYLYLPVTLPGTPGVQLRGPFVHRPGDDDSSAVTFWGKRALRENLLRALRLLDEHENRTQAPIKSRPEPPPPENAEGDAQPASRSSRKHGVANVSEENGKTT